MKPIYPAVKAVIVKDGKFLALKKKGVEGEVFELPGGRMNYGETHGEALLEKFMKKQNYKYSHLFYMIRGNFSMRISKLPVLFIW